MRRPEISSNLIRIRRLRMWTQGRLADEAGVSPTTISGIESGRISRPHFGTIRKLAEALGVDPERLLLSHTSEKQRDSEVQTPLSLEWAMAVREEEFERELDEASLESLRELLELLAGEQERLQRLYEQFPRGSEQQRFIKRQIRNIAAHTGSVDASLTFRRSNREVPRRLQ